MRKFILLTFTVIMLSVTQACDKGSSILENNKLLIFAGAGMRQPLDEIEKTIMKKCNIKAVYNYGGSGRLLNRILAGHIPDIFIPGSMKWANILKEKGYIKDYKSIAYHIPVIITPTGNFKIKSLKDFYKKNNRIVLGSDGVCAIGKVSSAILKKAGLKKAGLKKAGLKKINIIAGGITVKHLVMWVSRNNADASIVWMADALQCNKECNKIRIIEIPKKYNCISIIPVCLMIKHKKKASVYIRHLLNQESRNIFRKHGFKVVR